LPLAERNMKAAATTDAERAAIRSAGQAMLAIWQGTAYDVSYVLGGIATLLIAVVMLRSQVFGRAIAYVGLVMGVLMLVPATAGTIGMYVSLISLVPTVIGLACSPGSSSSWHRRSGVPLRPDRR
jgi:hypothetical protein